MGREKNKKALSYMGSGLWNKHATITKNIGGHVSGILHKQGQFQKPPEAPTYILSILFLHVK